MFNPLRANHQPTQINRLYTDALSTMLAFFDTNSLRNFAKTSKLYRKLVYKQVFNPNRSSMSDSNYQCQLLRNWAISPAFIFADVEYWEKTLIHYVKRPQTAAANRYFALICLIIIALKNKDQQKINYYLNLLILHTQFVKPLLLSGLYCISNFCKNSNLSTQYYAALMSGFKLGFLTLDHYFNNRVYEDFNILNAFSCSIVAKACDETFPLTPTLNQYAIEALTLIGPYVKTQPAISYLHKLLMILPEQINNERTAMNFYHILKCFFRVLPDNVKQECCRKLYQSIENHFAEITNTTECQQHTVDAFSFMPIWLKSIVFLLKNNDIIQLFQQCINLLKFSLNIQVIETCQRLLDLLAHQLEQKDISFAQNLIHIRALECLNSMLENEARYLDNFSQFATCFKMLPATKINIQINIYFNQLISSNGINNIFRNPEIVEILPIAWPELVGSHRDHIFQVMMASYHHSDPEHKNIIIKTLGLIAPQLSILNSLTCIDLFINHSEMFQVASEFLDIITTLQNTCASLAKNLTNLDRESISKSLQRKIFSSEILDKHNITSTYINFQIMIAMTQQLDESRARLLADKVKVACLEVFHQSRIRVSSPRTFRNNLDEILIYLKLLNSIVPYLDYASATTCIFGLSNTIIAFFSAQRENLNVCCRPIIRALTDLVQSNANILYDEKNTPHIDALAQFVLQRYKFTLPLPDVNSNNAEVQQSTSELTQTIDETHGTHAIDRDLPRQYPPALLNEDASSSGIVQNKLDQQNVFPATDNDPEVIKNLGDSPRTDADYRLSTRA